MKTNLCRYFGSADDTSKPHSLGAENVQARSRKTLRGVNSERYPVQGRKDRSGKFYKKDSSTSSSDSKEEVRPQLSARESNPEHFSLLLGSFRPKPLESTFTESFPLASTSSRILFQDWRSEESASARGEGPVRPVIALRTESSCGGIKNKSVLDSCVSDKSCVQSARSRGPRIGESLCRHLIQSTAARKSKCSYFHLKTGNFVSPKIVKVSRSYRPWVHESTDFGHFIERAERQSSYKHLSLISRGERTSMGSTDKSKAKKEEVKRIFKLGQFKSRASSDLFLDNYKKRISFNFAESAMSPRESVPVVPIRNFSFKGPLKKSEAKTVKGTFLLLKRVNNSKAKIAVNYSTNKT
eukprot:TRINITY_DN4513_c0_g1_i3.p1 TRINITY_DN4513_c0_g1~~TRINITY_DN4513_c0_g1_i3.p1  ORF type:complete len:354 (+),score=81.74 TRINITY_DN4513_c0_g1_i3:202-1263(+)